MWHSGCLSRCEESTSSTLALAFDFSPTFAADWKRREAQAYTPVAAPAALLDPRYKSKAGKILPQHLLDAQNFIVEHAERLCGAGAGVKAQVCRILLLQQLLGCSTTCIRACLCSQAA